jgi:hypothetical protein
VIWANFLHIYQPPSQKPDILGKVTNESYRKILAELKRTRRAKVTLNINAILTELLVKEGYDDVVRDLKDLALRDQVELTGSAKYHPLLPKIPKEEAVRQIKLNDETNRKYFGAAWQPRGFFPPEMGFSMDVAKIVAELGFQWIIADELSYPRESGTLGYDKTYRIKGLPLKIFFREREISFKILSAQLGTGKLLLHELGPRVKEDKDLLTAMDGETFGHHRLGLEQLLFDLYRSPKIQPELISDLPNYFPQEEEILPGASTWALTAADLERQIAFNRWDDPDNPIHRMQWELTHLAIEAVQNAPQREGWLAARESLDRSLHSDQYWWAGAKPWWSIEYIERGAKELLRTVELTPGIAQNKLKRAQELYASILSQAFDWQREGVVDRLARAEDEEVRRRVDINLPAMARREFDRMIKNLKQQMQAAARDEEFERAAQFRNRIAELQEKKEKIPSQN